MKSAAEVGAAGEGSEHRGCGCPDPRTYLLGSGIFGHAVRVRDVGHNTPHWEGVLRIPPQGLLKADS